MEMKMEEFQANITRKEWWALVEVIDHYILDEEAHYESDPRGDHIFKSLSTLGEFMHRNIKNLYPGAVRYSLAYDMSRRPSGDALPPA